ALVTAVSRRLRRRGMRLRELRRELAFYRRANVAYRRAGGVHLARLGRDVDAHRAFDAVILPLQHVAVCGAGFHEAVVVAAVTSVLASAEARNVARHLGVLGGEHERGGHDLWWSRRRVPGEGNRWQHGLLVRTESRRRPGAGFDLRRWLGRGAARARSRGRLIGGGRARPRPTRSTRPRASPPGG